MLGVILTNLVTNKAQKYKHFGTTQTSKKTLFRALAEAKRQSTAAPRHIWKADVKRLKFFTALGTPVNDCRVLQVSIWG